MTSSTPAASSVIAAAMSSNSSGTSRFSAISKPASPRISAIIVVVVSARLPAERVSEIVRIEAVGISSRRGRPPRGEGS